MHPSNNPLTTADRESMIGYVLRGATPREDWKTGLEIELIGYDRDELQRIDAETVDKLLHEYSSEHLLEGGTLSGARRATGALTVEPGCQVEFSGVARSRLDEARQDLSGFLDWLTDRARELNLIFVGIGFDPLRAPAEQKWFEKPRYGLMRPYLEKCGQRGLDMMTRTASVQVNVDFASAEDLAKKFVVGNRLAPIVGAIFANSPFREGKLSGARSERALVWLNTDADRCGVSAPSIGRRFSMEAWLDSVLSTPMFFVRRGDLYRDMSTIRFGEFLAEPTDGLQPQITDFADHLTTIFTEVRLKQWLELRSADGGGKEQSLEIQALWKGLLYDETSLDEVIKLLPALSLSEFSELTRRVAWEGLSTEAMGISVMDIARPVVELARDGLKRQGAGEESYLDGVSERVLTEGISPADILIENFEGSWHGDIGQAIEYVRVV